MSASRFLYTTGEAVAFAQRAAEVDVCPRTVRHLHGHGVGMFDASVAANSELWMMPPARRLLVVSGLVSMRVETCCRPCVRRSGGGSCRLSSGTQRTVRRIRRWSSVAPADTMRRRGPARAGALGVSLRMKAAAAGRHAHALQQRLGVSLLRTCSERNSEKAGRIQTCRLRHHGPAAI